jgi:hypothetical protein
MTGWNGRVRRVYFCANDLLVGRRVVRERPVIVPNVVRPIIDGRAARMSP